MMVKKKVYVDVINLLHEAEPDAGVGEGSCSTKYAPGAHVVTFLKPAAGRRDRWLAILLHDERPTRQRAFGRRSPTLQQSQTANPRRRRNP